MNKDRERGKALEREGASMLGYRRRRNGEGLGFDDAVKPDGSETEISVEFKAPKVLQLRAGWIEQARRNASGRPWLLVQRPLGCRTIYATCDFRFLVALLSEAGYVVETPPDDTHGESSSESPAEPGAASSRGALGPTASL